MNYAFGAGRAALFDPHVEVTYPERATDYLDQRELADRLKEAAFRVIKVIRFADIVLLGKGYCHEVTAEMLREKQCYGNPSDPAVLAAFIDKEDRRRSDKVFEERRRADFELLTQKIRITQNMNRRRSALFGGQDIAINIFQAYPPTSEDIRELVDKIRLNLTIDAVKALMRSNDLWFMDGVWNIKVSTADEQRLAQMGQNSNRVKYDDRSFHGHPNRDR